MDWFVELQNTAESLDKALSLLKQLDRPMLKAVAFTALLALTQVFTRVIHTSSIHTLR